jgi:hypothetical protein
MIRCLASHSVPLHAATGLSAHPEVAHLPAEPSICDRCDRFRRSRWAIRRRPRMDHASWPVHHQGAGWHPLRAYRAIVDLASVVAMSLFQSCGSARRPKALRARLLRGTHWTWPVDDFHRIAQGHHLDASCLAFGTRSSAIARRAKRTTIPLRRLHCASATNNPKHCKNLLQKVKIFKACCYLAIPLRFGYRG